MPRTGSLPALLPCAAFLGGALASPSLVTPAWAAPGLLALAVAAHLAGRRRVTLACASAALFCGGLLLDGVDRSRAAARGERCLPGAAATEREVLGTVAALPELDSRGWSVLRLRTVDGCTLGVRVAPAPAGAEGGALSGLAAGDRVRVWCRLSRPRGYLNPGARDAAESLRRAGLDAYASVKSARLLEVLKRGDRGARRLADALKRAARARLDGALGPSGEVRALAGAMLLGDRRALRPATLRRLRDAGLAHLISISGLHVGWLTLLLVIACRRGRLGPAAVLLACAAFLALFVPLVGARPSVLRAAWAAGTVLAARAIGRDGAPLNTLALIAAGLVAAEPASVRDPGFQLSFVATAGILRLTGLPVVLSAYLATSPLAALHLGRQAPVGLAANLAGVPLAGLLLLLGYAAVVLAGVPLLGPAAAVAAATCARALLGLAAACSGVPGGAFAVAPPGGLLLLAYYGLLASFPARHGPPATTGACGAYAAHGAALALAALAIHGGPPPRPAPSTEVHVIDVGQGQAVAALGPEGGTALIDAGGAYPGSADLGERVVVPYLLRLGIRRLDALILSHEHLDHAGGAPAVIRDLEVGEVWVGPRALGHEGLRAVVSRARRAGAAIVVAEAGRRRAFGGLRLAVVWPDRAAAAGVGNDDSVAVLLGRPGAGVLVPGDLEAAGEAGLVAGGADLRAGGLVLPHHGSRSGSGPALLRAAAPRFAVASVGWNNRFGHPAPEVIRRLRERRIPLWRTDLHGRVRLYDAGPGGFRVDAWRGD